MKVLSIDTSSKTASAAVFDDDILLGEFLLNTPIKHSQKLMPMIESLLGMLGLRVKDIGLILACEGPGSFTGVRIGLSTVKAFAQVCDIPVITDTSMAILAGAFQTYRGIIIPVIDAKRGDVYFGEMYWEKNMLYKIDEGTENIVELLNRISGKYLDKEILLIGDGVSIYKDEISKYLKHPAFALAGGDSDIPRASSLKYLMYKTEDKISYKEVRANYMRKSQAERDTV